MLKSLLLGVLFIFLIPSSWADALPMELITNIAPVTRVTPANPLTPAIICSDEVTAFTKTNVDFNLGAICPSTRGIEITGKRCFDPSSSFNGGYVFQSGVGNRWMDNASNPYGSSTTSRPRRTIKVMSTDKALNETYLYVEDVTVNGPDSHDVKSTIFILPRKTVPHADIIGNEIHLTLMTGELVILDKDTSEIKSGALTEGAPDFNIDRFKRAPPNVNYSGTGISIRLSHRYEDPRASSPTAVITQSGMSCTVPRTKFFSADGKVLSQSDHEFLSAIRSACPGKSFHL